MMSLTFGLFTQMSGSGPLGPLVFTIYVFPRIKSLRKQGTGNDLINSQYDLH